CWSTVFGYECCDDCNVFTSDENGDWGVKNGEWCGIKSSLCKNGTEGCPKTNYPCCSHCNVAMEDKTARWGIENGDWCTI
ncbi:Non-catalytic module family DOC2, partial [Piromyces sp. E2]